MYKMFHREQTSAASMVRLPPISRTQKSSLSHLEYIHDFENNPWVYDNPALRQLSTAGVSRVRRTKSRLGKRSFRNKVILPDLNLYKTRNISSARSMRSNISAISSATIKSTKSLDMFRYGESSPRKSAKSSISRSRQKRRPGSNTNSVSTSVPLPPIGGKTRSEVSAGDIASTVDFDDVETESVIWPDKGTGYTDLESELKISLGDDYRSHKMDNFSVSTQLDVEILGSNINAEDINKENTEREVNENNNNDEHVDMNVKEGKEERKETETQRNKEEGEVKSPAEATETKSENERTETEEHNVESCPVEAVSTRSCREVMRRLFVGDYSDLPTTPRTAVRMLFIASSTDFHEERDWFMSRCYTQLQTLCNDLDLDFYLIDLELTGFDHVPSDVMDAIYREQLIHCDEQSAGPTVLAFVNGDNLPRPVPNHIPANDYHALCEAADKQGLPGASLLKICYSKINEGPQNEQQFYKLNEHLGQRFYLMQVKDGLTEVDEEFTSPINAWTSVAVRLREVIRKALVSAVVKGKVSKEQAKAYLEPVSDQQITQTITALPARTHCYIRQRKTEELQVTKKDTEVEDGPQRVTEHGKVYLDVSHKVDSTVYQLTDEESKGHVYYIHPLHDHQDEPAYISQQQRLYLTKLCEDITDDFKSALSSVPKALVCSSDCMCSLTPLHAEVLHHARICEARSWLYRGSELLNVVKDYILDDNHSMVPLIISGAADKGKSKLAAAIAKVVKYGLHPDTVVITRFLGTSPDSQDIKWVLIGIIYQICQVYEMAMPLIDELLNFDRTVGCLNALIASVAMQFSAERPLMIILDSLENLVTSDGNNPTTWIPQICPPNIYLIATISSQCKTALNTLRYKLIEERSFLSLDNLDAKDNKSDETVDRNGTSSETDASEDGKKSSQSVDDHSKDEKGDMSSDVQSNKDTLKSRPLQRKKNAQTKSMAVLVSRRLDLLEKRYGELVMSWFFSYLLIGEGLSEVELADALSCNSDVMEEVFIGSDVPKEKQWRFPQKLLSLIRRDISKFLEHRYIDGKSVLAIGDEQVRESVSKRYFDSVRKADCCLHMAELLRHSETSNFLGVNDFESDYFVFNKIAPQQLKYKNTRQLRMLPRLLYNSGHFSSVGDEMKSEVLCNFKWIYTKLKAFEAIVVIDDYLQVREWDSDVQYVHGLLMLAKAALQQKPENLATEILARCSKHARDQSVHINKFWIEAYNWFTQNSSGLYLMPMYQCLFEPSGVLVRTISGPWHVLGNCDNGQLAVWGKETGLEIWNPSTYECVHHLCSPFTWEDSLLSQEKDIIYHTSDTHFLGWDVRSSKMVCDIDILPHVSVTGRQQNPNTDDSFLSPMAISPDKIFAAVRINKPEMLINNNGLALVDIQRELVVHTAIESMGDRVSNCQFTKDNNRLIVTETQILPGQISIIHIFDCLTMELMGKHELDDKLTIVPDTMHLTPDDAHVVVGSRPDNVLVYATKDCNPVCVPTEFPEEDLLRFVDMKLLPDDMILQLSIDTSQASVLRICDLNGQFHGPVMTSQSGRPKFVNVFAKYSLAFVGHLDDGTIDVWDYQAGVMLFLLRGHSGHVTSTLLCPQDRLFYTGGTDAVIKVWNLEYMLIDKGYTIDKAERRTDPRRAKKSRQFSELESPDIRRSNLNLDRIIHHDDYCSEHSILDASLDTSVYETSEASISLGVSTAESTPVPTSRATMNTRTPDGGEKTAEIQRPANAETETELKANTSTDVKLEISQDSTEHQVQNQMESTDEDRKTALSKMSETQMDKTKSDLETNGTVDKTDDLTDSYKEQLNHVMNLESVQQEQSKENEQKENVPSKTILSADEELNSKLEEIFHKLDTQNQTEYPVLEDNAATPTHTTTVLGSQGEQLNRHITDIMDVNKFVLTRDRQWLVTSYKKGPPVVWDLETSDIISRMEMPWDTGTITEIMLDGDDWRLFALARLGFVDAQKYGCDNCVRVWDLRSGLCEPMPEEPLLGDSFKLTPDYTKLILLRMRDSGTRFTVLDANSLEKLTVGEVNCQLKSPYFLVTSDIKWIITCEPGVMISFWNIKKEDEYGISEHIDVLLASIPPAMVLIDKEQRILVGTGFGNIFSIELCGVADLEPSQDLLLVSERHRGEVLCLKLSEDQEMLVSSSADGTLQVIDVKKRKVRHVLQGHQEMVTCIDISRSNQLVASGSSDRTVRLWSCLTGQALDVFNAYHDVFSLSICPLGRHVCFLMDQQHKRTMVMSKITGQLTNDNVTANIEDRKYSQ